MGLRPPAVLWLVSPIFVLLVGISCGGSTSQGRIVYVTCPSSVTCDFVAVDSDGSNRQRLFSLEVEEGDTPLLPQCSPDGGEIVYFLSVGQRTSIFKANLDGSQIVELTPDFGAVDPAWSPDGSRIVFSASAPDPAQPQLWVMNSDGSEAHPITSDRVFNLVPAWSPDGGSIAFASDGTEGPADPADVWIVSADGADPRPLITGAANDRQPAWSPDGQTLAFTRVEGEPGVIGTAGSGGQVFLATDSGQDIRPLTAGGPRKFLPRWSPDGEQIAFSTAPDSGEPFGMRDRRFQVYVIGAGGDGQRMLTDEPNGAHFATWCPNP